MMHATTPTRTNTQRRRRLPARLRAGLALGALGLLLSHAGDRGQAQSVASGIDPLEVLNLLVRPNVFIVLDSSISMAATVNDNNTLSGDHPESRMRQAKEALYEVIEENQETISFQLAQYYQANVSIPNTQNKWEYGTSLSASPSMGTNEIRATYSATNHRIARTLSDDFVEGGETWYRLFSQKFYNGNQFYALSTGTVCSESSAGTPDPVNPFIMIQMVSTCTNPSSNTVGSNVRWDFYGVRGQTWSGSGDGNQCSGYDVLVNLVDCDVDDQISTMGAFLRREIEIDETDGEPIGFTQGSDGTISNQPDQASYNAGTGAVTAGGGIRSASYTPISASLADVKTQFDTYWNDTISGQTVKQTSYVLLLTDGDDTCVYGIGGGDQAARNAAYKAQLLHDGIAGVTDPEASVTTFVVVFGTGASATRADYIAWGGSGMKKAASGGEWTSNPTAAERAACTTCRDAFITQDKDALVSALRSALSAVTSTGTFSTSANTLGTVFELGPQVNDPDCVDYGDPNPDNDPICADPLNPNTRYNNRVNVLYQSVMEVPGFKGHLYAYANVPGTGLVQMGYFDAGDALYDVVTYDMEQGDVGYGQNLYTFDDLKGDATARYVDASTAVLKRRVFTSSPTPPSGYGSCTGTAGLNCSYTRDITELDDWDQGIAQGSNVVALWPPNQANLNNGVTDVDPAVGSAGPFDDILGIGAGSSPVLTYAQLKARYGACAASVDGAAEPDECDQSADATLALNTARKEARQIILAYTAGAELSLGSDGKPVRADDGDPTTFDPLLYTSRDWLLLDSTLSQPAVSSPPLRNTPDDHIKEFLLYRDGRRGADRQGINEIDQGFGLRNPDFDDVSPETKTDLKPVMSVVYIGANDGLHAFRAGPECGDDDYVANCMEIGLEELWNFVPFDQLGTLAELAERGQRQDPHVYMIASSPRMGDIFVEGDYTLGGVTYEGRWRNVLVFGRGPGGKFYTMLDITSPGPFTDFAMETNPPFVMWNHGNEDGVVDDYDGMGQTWSVPAIGFLGSASTPEWAVWTGSGYGAGGSEGKTFYMLDAVDGSVLLAKSVGDGDTSYVANNALVASPTAYNAFQLDPPGTVLRSTDQVTRVYIPDLHGRIWKFDVSSGGVLYDAGASQPFGNAVALLSLDGGNGRRPQIFAESGNDSRVPLGLSPGFSVFSIEDPLGASDYTDDQGILNFTREFDDNGLDNGSDETGFRGTTQPATAFNAEGNGRVFFIGTRFNTPGASCVSSFDSILLALGALSGDAVYDFNDDGDAEVGSLIEGTRVTGIQTQGGQLVMGGSGGQGVAPEASVNDPSAPPPSAPQPAVVSTMSMLVGGNYCLDY